MPAKHNERHSFMSAAKVAEPFRPWTSSNRQGACDRRGKAVKGGGRRDGFEPLLNQFYLALWGIVLAAAVVISCAKMEDRYLKGRTFFADPVGYLEESIFL